MFSIKDDLMDALFCNFDIIKLSTNCDETSPIIEKLRSGEFLSIIEESPFTQLFTENINEDLILNQCKDRESFLNLLGLGISACFVFIQSNWTGPVLENDDPDEKIFREKLALDGEEVNENILNCKLIYISRLIFTKLQEEYPSVVTNIWRIRSIFLHQSILDERSTTLFNEFVTLHKSFNIEHAKDERNIARFYTEISHMQTYYGLVDDANESLTKAKECIGMEMKLTGEMGMRTKYQRESLPQVRLTIDLSTQHVVAEQPNLPEIIKLEDDVRLDSIKWDRVGTANVALTGLEQAILLADVAYRQRALPQDVLSTEEITPCVNYVLEQNCCWPARVKALYTKCKLESNNKRTIDRSLNQCESIVRNLNVSEPSLTQRIENFWAISPVPIYKIQALLAKISLSMGLIKTALDLYISLSLWEEVVLCYTILQLSSKAAEIIQQEIDKKPTVKLLCLLGDATDDVSCYEKAWELSNFKSGQPYRFWGQNYFENKMYEECIPLFQKSLEINSLQSLVWLRLGYAALSVRNWELAAAAYRRYTAIEPNSFEAWNNLARAYIALGDKNRAYKAFSEALKTSYDNWQVWENFMITGLDTGHFDDVIRSYHRLLDLRGKHLDVEILTILVEAVSRNRLDHDGNETSGLLHKCMELLGRVTSIYQNEYKPWELYAQLTTDDYLKVQRLQRAHRGLVQRDSWSRDPDKCEIVIKNGIALGEACSKVDDSTLKKTVRLSLRAALVAVQKENWEQHSEIIAKLDSIVKELSL